MRRFTVTATRNAGCSRGPVRPVSPTPTPIVSHGHFLRRLTVNVAVVPSPAGPRVALLHTTSRSSIYRRRGRGLGTYVGRAVERRASQSAAPPRGRRGGSLGDSCLWLRSRESRTSEAASTSRARVASRPSERPSERRVRLHGST